MHTALYVTYVSPNSCVLCVVGTASEARELVSGTWPSTTGEIFLFDFCTFCYIASIHTFCVRMQL